MFKSSLHTCTELDHVCEVWLLRGNGEMMRGSVGKLLMCFEFWTWDSEVSSHRRVTFVLCWGYMSIYRVSKLGSPTTSTAPRYISCRFPSLNDMLFPKISKYPRSDKCRSLTKWWLNLLLYNGNFNRVARRWTYHAIHCTLYLIDFYWFQIPFFA